MIFTVTMLSVGSHTGDYLRGESITRRDEPNLELRDSQGRSSVSLALTSTLAYSCLRSWQQASMPKMGCSMTEASWVWGVNVRCGMREG